jgi:hypothetical protein
VISDVSWATAGAVSALVAGFAVAAASDLKRREVSDRLWQALGVVGLGLGTVEFGSAGLLPLVLWVVVAAFTIQHLVPWDLWLGDDAGRFADGIELGAYVVVVAAVAIVAGWFGVGATRVPWAVIAVLATVLLARALFEFGVLYGGADAKALMVSAVLVPTFAFPLVYAPDLRALAYLPFSVSLLTNSALFSLAVPVGLAIRNARRGEFSLSDGFTGYSLPVAELPRRFVWVKDPAAGPNRRDEAETTEEDDRIRSDLAKDLAARGIARVWVTPQVPFLAVMAFGTVAALLAGNLLLDVMLRV